MISEINLSTPKTTGIVVPTSADFVLLHTSKTRRYLEVINNSEQVVEFAIGQNSPANEDYIKVGENGHWAATHTEFFSSITSIKLWLKAPETASIVIIS